ncbi:MAG: insulinase family protein [Gemmatimonadota bacterium]|nr:MAG: insulinase family protein [Gemmatimonadota bacterium]
MRPGIVNFELCERRLNNGLRVIVQEDHTTPVVSLHIMYHVGSKHEPPGRTGFAHLFEHLMFQGSEHVPDDAHFRYVQDAGGTLNGSTWFDRTNYFETLPSNELELGLWLESDRLGFFESAITQEKLDNQRDVVKNERRQSYENRPYGLAVETVLRMAYPEGHPYRHPTIGYMEDLDAASLSDVKDFFRTFYTPDNAIIVLVGALEAQRGIELADRYFGGISPGPGAPQVTAPLVPPGCEAREEIYDNVQFPRVYIFHHAPAFGQPGFEAADVLCYLLSEGKSSRLYRELVYEQRIAQDVSAQVWPTEDCGLSFIVATARPGVEAATLESAILETLAEVHHARLAEREAEGAVNRALRELVGALDGVSGRSDAIATAATFLDQPGYINEIFGRVRSVTPEAMVQVAKEWFVPERRSILYVLPETSEGDGS